MLRRREFLLASGASVGFRYRSGPLVRVASAVVDGHISYGQSWRSNSFPSFAAFGINNIAPLAPHYVNPLAPTRLFGALPSSAGIGLPGNIDGITNYPPSAQVAIGNAAIAAQQMLRIRDGVTALKPTIEADFAFPSSSWGAGGGGGLSPGASFTASITSDVMTVTAVASGIIISNQLLSGTGLATGSMVVDGGTGTGGTGTYNIAVGQQTILVNPDGSLSSIIPLTTPGAVFTGQINNTSALPGNVLSVASVTSGTITVGATVSGVGVVVPTVITAQTDGTPGGIGSYTVRTGAAQTLSGRALTSAGVSWTNQLQVLTQLAAAMPAQSYAGVLWSSVGYTQGASVDGTTAGKEADLVAMIAAYDALALNPTPLKFYWGIPSAVSNTSALNPSFWGTYTFSRTNAPTAGGPYSGRVYATGPSYAYQFNGGDNIHTGAYGSTRWGEVEGYARWLVQDKGIGWTPLWRPLTGGAITRSGQVLTVPFARPTSPDFAAGVLSMQSNADDGIKVWPQNGFNVKRGGAALTVTSVVISGLNVLLTIGQPLSTGDALEVSYAWYGPGGPNPGSNSGVGGNLVMQGPSSVLYPNGWNGAAKTIDAWAWPFVETITA